VESINRGETASGAGPRLVGRTAVVTGASSGIGRAIARAFAAEGADLLLTYRRNAHGAAGIVEEIRAMGRRAEAVRVDLGCDEDIERLVGEAFMRFDRVDVWVNNAGADILTGEGATLAPAAKLDRVLAVDLRGTVLCSWAVAERMRRLGGGVVINMSWDHVLTGMAGIEAEIFSAAKGGILAFSKSLARSMAPEVRVHVLAPGWIETAFAAQLDERDRRRIEEGTPLRRLGTPEDVARAALFLASADAEFLTGVMLPINGGVVL